MAIVATDDGNYCMNITLRSCDKAVSSSLILFSETQNERKASGNYSKKIM